MALIKFIIVLLVLIVFINITLADSNSNKYYAIKSDVRRCAFPICGGYFLKEINSKKNISTDIYVPTLVLLSTLANVKESQYRYAPQYHIVVYGVIEGAGTNSVLRVNQIYRLLTKPNKQFDISSSRFYKVNSSSNNQYTISKLNSNKFKTVPNISNTYGQDVALIQLDWVDFKIKSGNSVFTTIGSKVDHVFISLPDPVFCPINLIQINCQNDTIATYSRSSNRCESFSGCVKRGACPLVIPSCPSDYTRISIISKPNGCPKYYCDPSFLYPNTN